MVAFNVQIPPYTFISGQIGLIPASLALPSPPITTLAPSPTTSSTLPLETALALQHTARIVRAAPNSRLGDGSDGGFGWSDTSSELATNNFSRDGSREGGWIQLAIYYFVRAADMDHVRRNVELVDGVRVPCSLSSGHAHPVMIEEADTDAVCGPFIASARCSHRETSPRAQRPIYFAPGIVRGRGGR